MLTNPTLRFKNSDYGLRRQINSDASDFFFPQLSAEVLQIFYFSAPFFFFFLSNELSSIAGLLYTLDFHHGHLRTSVQFAQKPK